jgi:hypothetical protein
MTARHCRTSPVMLPTNAFIYFKEYRDNEQSLTYPSERLVETVSASVTVGWYDGRSCSHIFS